MIRGIDDSEIGEGPDHKTGYMMVAGGGGGSCYNSKIYDQRFTDRQKYGRHVTGKSDGGTDAWYYPRSEGNDHGQGRYGAEAHDEGGRYPPGAGGVNGLGGQASTNTCGTGGGGGLVGSGQDSSGTRVGSKGGMSFLAGGQGTSKSTGDAGDGGFGGGSGGNNDCITSAGAGGGYSGGGAGGHSTGGGAGGTAINTQHCEQCVGCVQGSHAWNGLNTDEIAKVVITVT